MTTMPVKTYRIIFAGTPAFALPILTTLHGMPELTLQAVITQPDKPIGRSQTITPPPVKRQAAAYGIPVLQPTTLRSLEIKDALLRFQPDVIIVVAYGKIIPAELLDIPRAGWINVHASLLPAYRGASPIQAAILNGDTETGVTLMRLDPGLDTGPIIAQQRLPLPPQETVEHLHDVLAGLGARLIHSALLPYLTGRLIPVPQQNKLASVTKPIQKKDGLIDWHSSASVIDRQIRAYNAWPGTFTFWNGTRLIIKKAHIADATIALPPGTTKRLGSTLLVGTSSSVLSLDEIQREGKKPQSAAAFLIGTPDISGSHLGQ